MSHAEAALDDPRTAELRRAGATLRRWMADEPTDGPAAFAPNAIVRFGPGLVESFEAIAGDEAPPGLIEAARTINGFESGIDSPTDGGIGQLDDAGR